MHELVVPCVGACQGLSIVDILCRSVAAQVEELVKAKKLAVTIGGDHSLALGTIYGTSRVYSEYCVVWIDAHADINTPETTQSGNIHGMPLSWLCGMTSNKIEGFEWIDDKPALPKHRLVYIGLRDLDAGEKKLLKDHNIKAYSMHQVDRYGIGQVVQMALDHVNPSRNLPIHLSFDVDALDPSVAPSTGTPVRGGLTFREGHYICEAIWETGLLVAMDLMEVNPTLGDASQHLQTTQIGCSLIRASLGESLL